MRKRTMACALLVGACSATYAQNWVAGGNNITGLGQYLGCNGTSTQPLRLTTVPNYPIELRTFNLQRARLNGNVTSSMGPGNPFPNVARDGFLLLSGQPDAFTNVSSRAPFTRLHLIDEVTGLLNPVVYAQEHGFRPWQRNGITFTGNSDQSYIGHKYDVNDNTDFVIQWSDNPNGSPWGTDRMKFVFTTQYSVGATKGAATTTGMEAIALAPTPGFSGLIPSHL